MVLRENQYCRDLTKEPASLEGSILQHIGKEDSCEKSPLSIPENAPAEIFAVAPSCTSAASEKWYPITDNWWKMWAAVLCTMMAVRRCLEISYPRY